MRRSSPPIAIARTSRRVLAQLEQAAADRDDVGESRSLKSQLAKAQRGEAFLLQGGDCAESFDECTSDNVVQKLKILLQMSLVMLVGLKKPIIRVGRMAGQYAKPRSADFETKDGVSLPSYRGDTINRPAFTAADREPDPTLMLRGYERAALTLNFVRSLIDGGFADLHHPENWDLAFVGESALAAEYHKLVQSVSDSLEFFEAISGEPMHETHRVEFFTSHEGLHLPYEQAQTRFLRAPAALVQLDDALSVDRHAHGRSERGARRVLPRHRESDGREDRHERIRTSTCSSSCTS